MDKISETYSIEKEPPVTLQQAIAKFLMSLPNIDTSDGQRTLVFHAGLDPQLHAQIPFDKPSAQFIQLLIPILLNYGRLHDGRHALEAVLEAAQNYVGQEKRADCTLLLQKLRTNAEYTQKLEYGESHYQLFPPIKSSNKHSYSEIVVCSRPQGARQRQEAGGAYLDLTDLFDKRFPRSTSYWEKEIPQRVVSFFQSKQVKSLSQPILIFFDCHLSIAFLVGNLLNPKFGLPITPVQKTRMSGYEIWSEPKNNKTNLWEMKILNTIDTEVIVSISVTNPIENHLLPFLKSAKLETIPRIQLQPIHGIGPRSIMDGEHAWQLGFELQTLLRSSLPSTCQIMHLFLSAPVAFAYILGNTLRYVTNIIQLYEHDFEGALNTVRYYPAIRIPTNNLLNQKE